MAMQNTQQQPGSETSVVSSCTVTDCRFNEEHCGTYSPEGDQRPRP